MRRLEGRLLRLEERLAVPEAEARKEAYRQFFGRLTREELEWLHEPDREAQSRVPCPHVEMLRCGCRSAARSARGFEARLEELEEHYERQQAAQGGGRW